MERVIRNLEELDEFATEFIERIVPNKHTATVVGLSGDLGAGKTAFVKAVAKCLGIREEVLSPTFVMAKFYAPHDPRWRNMVHIDAYRVEDPEELKALRLSELLHSPESVIFFEWPENAGGLLPKDIVMLNFAFVDEATRTVRLLQ